MNPRILRQRGEGKVGCFVSLFVLLAAVAVIYKAFPVYWNNSQFKDAAKELASRASVMSVAAIETQLKAKALELEIPQAAAPGAISVQKSGDSNSGNCIVKLRYSQKIDFYGITDYKLDTEESISTPYINGN